MVVGCGCGSFCCCCCCDVVVVVVVVVVVDVVVVVVVVVAVVAGGGGGGGGRPPSSSSSPSSHCCSELLRSVGCSLGLFCCFCWSVWRSAGPYSVYATLTAAAASSKTGSRRLCIEHMRVLSCSGENYTWIAF